MTTRETLAEIRSLIRERDKKQSYIDRLWETATNISPVLDGMPHGGDTSTKVERYSIERADKAAELNDIKMQLSLYSKEIKKEIMRIKDERNRDALGLRYIECLTVKEVADRMSYNRESMYKILQQAEAELQGDRCYSEV